MDLNPERRAVAKAAIFISGEGVMIFVSTVLMILGHGAYHGSLQATSIPVSKVISFSLLCQASIYYCGLYNDALRFGLLEQVLGLMQAFALAMAILIVTFLCTGNSVDPVTMIAWFGVLIISTSIWRFFIQKMASTDLFCQKAILLGTDQSAQEIYRCAMMDGHNDNYGCFQSSLKIVAVTTCDEGACRIEILPDTAFTNLENNGQLISLVHKFNADYVIVAKSLIDSMPANEVYELKHHNIKLIDTTSVLEKITGRRDPDSTDPNHIIFSKSFQRSVHRFFKRFGDIVISFSALILLSPVMLMVIGGMKIGRQPLVFKTKSCFGLRKQVFKCFSFHNPSQSHKNKFHNRRIQALPQLWNVLKGDMSLVGPLPVGPERADDISHELPIFDERFTIRPGLTGWAQVNGDHDCSSHTAKHMLGYDLFYLKHMSLFLDIVVLCRALRFYSPGDGLVRSTS